MTVAVLIIAVVASLIAGELLLMFMVAAVGLSALINETGLYERSTAAKWLARVSLWTGVGLLAILFYTHVIA